MNQQETKVLTWLLFKTRIYRSRLRRSWASKGFFPGGGP